MSSPVRLKILRRDKPDASSYWESFEVARVSGMSVLAALDGVALRPTNANGEAVAPVGCDAACREGACGSCAMLINGKPALACQTRVDGLAEPLRLEPLATFPVVRDLAVDRSRIEQSLITAQAWVNADPSSDAAAAERVSQRDNAAAEILSRCTSCGLCLEACPQFNERSPYLGAVALSQVQRYDRHPVGRFSNEQRLDALMARGGPDDCGNAQNCVHACPEAIPLTESIAAVGRLVTRQALKRILG